MQLGANTLASFPLSFGTHDVSLSRDHVAIAGASATAIGPRFDRPAQPLTREDWENMLALMVLINLLVGMVTKVENTTELAGPSVYLLVRWLRQRSRS